MHKINKLLFCLDYSELRMDSRSSICSLLFSNLKIKSLVEQ